MQAAIGQVGTRIGCASKPGIQHQKTSFAGWGVLPNVARCHSVLWPEPGYTINPDLLARSPAVSAVARRPAGNSCGVCSLIATPLSQLLDVPVEEDIQHMAAELTSAAVARPGAGPCR